jgi:hypothetical protein
MRMDKAVNGGEGTGARTRHSARARDGGHCGSRMTGLAGLLAALLVLAATGTASAQFANSIASVNPSSAAPGTNNLVVTFTLETDFPPPPPAGDGPQSVMIGSLAGTSITHTNASTVAATFSIPAGEAGGTKDVTITFAVPGGTLVFSKAGGFTVTGAVEQYNIERTLADGAQQNTIAFDGLAFLTGCLGAQSFLPPGKVADYSGFQFLRDNDPTQLGHNTDFVTIIAFNVLNILSADQRAQLVASAEAQVGEINEFAYSRYPLLKAFRRQFDGDIPAGSAGLDSAAVVAYTADLYRIDGRISYRRAQLMGGIVTSLTTAQRAALDSLGALNGIGNWDRTLTDPLQSLHLAPDVSVAVMTYASEMYAWYAGSVEADTYFCPERHGTYFGSFYLKDWPAMGNPNYTIDEQLTATAGEQFLAIMTPSQAAVVTGLVGLQRTALYETVDRRTDISTLLRGFAAGQAVDSAAVMDLSARYGELDGQMGYWYAVHFSHAWDALSTAQRAQVTALADSLGYLVPAGGFLYSQPIAMPEIMNTDFLFGVTTSGIGGSGPAPAAPRLWVTPNPAVGPVAVRFTLPGAGPAKVAVYDSGGRLARVLDADPLAEGIRELSWAGTDASGRRMPAGVYFVRLDTRSGTRSVKLTLAR